MRWEAWTFWAVVAAASGAQRLGQDSGCCTPRGARAAGPGLASRAPAARLRKWEWNSPATGRGQGALGAEAAPVAIGKRNRLGCPDAEWEGAAGKAREGSGAGTGPPPFFGSLNGRGGLQGRAKLVGQGQQSQWTILR